MYRPKMARGAKVSGVTAGSKLPWSQWRKWFGSPGSALIFPAGIEQVTQTRGGVREPQAKLGTRLTHDHPCLHISQEQVVRRKGVADTAPPIIVTVFSVPCVAAVSGLSLEPKLDSLGNGWKSQILMTDKGGRSRNSAPTKLISHQQIYLDLRAGAAAH